MVAVDKSLSNCVKGIFNPFFYFFDQQREMREENLRFMQYCAMNREEGEEREKNLEQLVNDEVEKKWKQTMEQYKLEREARKQLMGNVMQTRQQQVEERSKFTDIIEKAFLHAYSAAGLIQNIFCQNNKKL